MRQQRQRRKEGGRELDEPDEVHQCVMLESSEMGCNSDSVQLKLKRSLLRFSWLGVMREFPDSCSTSAAVNTTIRVVTFS
jgi:hypothetical protein